MLVHGVTLKATVRKMAAHTQNSQPYDDFLFFLYPGRSWYLHLFLQRIWEPPVLKRCSTGRFSHGLQIWSSHRQVSPRNYFLINCLVSDHVRSNLGSNVLHRVSPCTTWCSDPTIVSQLRGQMVLVQVVNLKQLQSTKKFRPIRFEFAG